MVLAGLVLAWRWFRTPTLVDRAHAVRDALFGGSFEDIQDLVHPKELAALGWSLKDAERAFDSFLAPRYRRLRPLGRCEDRALPGEEMLMCQTDVLGSGPRPRAVGFFVYFDRTKPRLVLSALASALWRAEAESSSEGQTSDPVAEGASRDAAQLAALRWSGRYDYLHDTLEPWPTMGVGGR